MEQFIESYGYLAILFGAFVEGEVVLVLGSCLAQLGYMDLTLVIFCAFSGTYAGDQACYFLGKYKGIAWLARRPHWQVKVEYAFTLIRKYRVLLILGFRYLYGLRSIIPFVVALSGIKPWHFIVLNGIGAMIWAITIGIVGYLLGNAIQPMLAAFEKFGTNVFIFMAAILLSTALLVYYRRRLS